MDSSTKPSPQPDILGRGTELQKLVTTRVSLRKAADLLGRSYQSTRTLGKNRHLIVLKSGGFHYVSLYEIRRFLQRGNATEQDWIDHETREIT